MRGQYMMTPTPAKQSAAPTMSGGSGSCADDGPEELASRRTCHRGRVPRPHHLLPPSMRWAVCVRGALSYHISRIATTPLTIDAPPAP
jgi:hypothetical protein